MSQEVARMTLLHADRPPETERRLAAVAAFEADLCTSRKALKLAGSSRETRMDAQRRLDVLERQYAAFVARPSATAARPGTRPRALVAHRHAWFARRLVELLQDHDVEVVGAVDNGAEAIGTAVAEQPDLVLVEDSLLMVPADEVVREIRRFCEGALIAAQVSSRSRVGALLDAGADTVVTRDIRPHDVVGQVLVLLPRRC
jgi:CheY-like chemotaxis protein